MVIYLVIFFFFFLSSIIEFLGDKKSAYVLLILSCSILLIITTFREGIGTDYYNYKEIFHEVTQKHIYSTEYGFTLLNLFAGFVGGFRVTLFLSALINLSCILFVLRKLRLNISLGVLTYYSLFYLNHNFNTIRHGLMCTLVWVGFYFYLNREKLKSILYISLGFMFHHVALAVLPFQFLARKKINIFISCILLISFYIIGSLMQNAFTTVNFFFTSDKLEYYQNDFYSEGILRYEFGLGFVLYVFIYFIVLKFNKYLRNGEAIIFLNNILFLGIAVILVFASVSIFVERIANVLLISLVFIFASLNRLRLGSMYKLGVLILICFINFFYLYKVMNLAGVDREYQFLPYKFGF